MHGNVKKLKIVMIGSTYIGKTVLANFISESVDMEAFGEPRPTQGVRIVEFELQDLNVNNKNVKAEVELWDCSGDHRFESCWPVLRKGVHGVILVCSPNHLQTASRDLELLYNYFVTQSHLSPKQCIVFYNTNGQSSDVKNLKLSPTFAKVSQISVNTGAGSNRLKIDFTNFIISIVNALPTT